MGRRSSRRRAPRRTSRPPQQHQQEQRRCSGCESDGAVSTSTDALVDNLRPQGEPAPITRRLSRKKSSKAQAAGAQQQTHSQGQASHPKVHALVLVAFKHAKLDPHACRRWMCPLSEVMCMLCGADRGRRAAVHRSTEGVVWHKSNSKWEARIYENGKQRFLGYFASEEEAARKYDDAALRISGPSAKVRGVLLKRWCLRNHALPSASLVIIKDWVQRWLPRCHGSKQPRNNVLQQEHRCYGRSQRKITVLITSRVMHTRR